MKRRLFVLLLTFLSMDFFTFPLFSNADKFCVDAWMYVNDNYKSNPQTAEKKIEEIKKHAEEKGDYPQLLKCVMVNSGVGNRYNDDFFEKSLKELREVRGKIKDRAAVAFSYYIEADMMYSYLYNNYHQVSRRSNLADVVPDDVKEWSKNIFVQNIRDLSFKALSEPALKEVESELYKELMNVGTHHVWMKEHKLYDFVVNNIIDKNQYSIFSDEEVLSFYSDLIAFHKDDSYKFLYVDAKIAWLKKKYDDETFSIESDYYRGLENLLNECGNEAWSLTVRGEMCKYIHKNINYDDLKFKNSDLAQKIYDLANVSFESKDARIEEIVNKRDDLKRLREIVSNMKSKYIRISFADNNHSQKPIRFKVKHANFETLKFTVYRDVRTLLEIHKAENKFNRETVKKIADYEFKLTPSVYNIKEDTMLEIPALPYGYYYVDVKGDVKNNDYARFSVTDIYGLDMECEHGSDYVFIDSRSGAPLEGVEVESYVADKELKLVKSEGESDKNGALHISKGSERNLFHGFKRGNDLFHDWNCIYSGGEKLCVSSDNKIYHGDIFFDRAVYRPGQTMNFKAILFRLSENGSSVKANEKCTVSLYSAGREKIGELSLISNEFGSVSGSFVLPQSAPLGMYYLSLVDSDNRECSKYFKVEEYERPTFEVKLDKPTASFSFGDSVKVSGSADYLFGAPLTAGNVTYKVERYAPFWRRFYGVQDENVASGILNLSKDGKFDISFVAEKDRKFEMDCSRFEVKVSVTDENGETCENTISVYVGDRSLGFYSPLNDKFLIEDLNSAKFRLCNLEGVGIKDRSVCYELKMDDKSVATGEVKSGDDGVFSLLLSTSELLSGFYHFVFRTKDDQGRVVEDTFKTILYRKDDKRPPVHTILWQDLKDKVSLAYGEKYTVRIGSSLKGAHLLMVTINAANTKKLEWFELDNEIKSIELSLQKEDQEAKKIDFYLVRDGSLHFTSVKLELRREDKSFPIELSVFRDKLLPGIEETWTITVPKERKAEVLASMYDASLDQFQKNKWNFCPKYVKSFWFKEYSNSLNQDRGRGSFSFGSSYFYIPPLLRGVSLNWVEFDSFETNWSVGMKGGNKGALLFSAEPEGLRKFDLTESLRGAGKSKKVSKEECVIEETVQTEDVKVRSDFAETAFFYPHMVPDSEGNLEITFKIPESLTRWNFMLLAHTKDLYCGEKSATILTQKPFMVSANLPRFLRDGDKIALTANVVNLSEEDKKGTVMVQLLDPMTEKVVAENSAPFDVKQKENGVVSIPFDVSDAYDALIVRTIAKGDGFSDAEQKLLPVLPNRTVVTQSMPLYVRGGQTKTYRFDKLIDNQSPTLRNNFLKVELASNPVWYAVQALPSVATVEFECATALSAAHFASQVAAHIASSNPRIFSMIEKWKSEGGDANTLLSQLEKNQEVKNILLNETPWVMEAKNETERKQRLSTLFDLQDLERKSDKWIEKLAEHRLYDGGYTWFKGGKYPSRHVSLFVADNIGRLRKAGLDTKFAERELKVKTTLSYLDNCLKNDYDNMKKYKYEPHCSALTLYYFQVRSLFPEIPLKTEAKEAYDFYFKLMSEKKEWQNFSLYEKSLATIALHRGGKQEVAKEIVNSLREHSSTTDEMGMYWKKNTSGWLWSESAISTHTRIMEAFELIDPKQEEQDNMRIWILNQKRTQDWGSVIANVDALNVFLLSGSNWVSNDNVVELKMGGKVVKPESVEAGTGYFSKTISDEQVKPSMGEVMLKSEVGGNMSWGALYWQFEENYDVVQKSKTALHVERMVMLETKNVDGTVVLKTIDKNAAVRVGDKITVRLTLRSDRDMDYVMLKDQRAAALEPQKQLSGYRYSDGIGYYYSPKDAAVYYFFDHLPKGTYVFEYSLYVTHAGTFSSGLATAQCLYAPEFVTNTEGFEIKVEKMK